MRVQVEQADGSWVVENAVPECGEDFCDGCGDCLECFRDDECPNGYHTWVVYEFDRVAFRDRLAANTPNEGAG